jgi:hypothetical protein
MLSTPRGSLTGVGWWLRLRLTGSRCLVCGWLFVAHTPWRSWRCNRTPLPFTITEQGLARLEEHGQADLAAAVRAKRSA